MSDLTCMDDVDLAEVGNDPMGAPLVPPLAWFESLPDHADPRHMAQAELCGDEIGRFWTMIGEADIPYMQTYADIEAPIADASESYYMNERAENPMRVYDDDDEIIEIAAGPIGFGHSPDSIATIDDLFDWHDREWGTAAKERPLARARLFEVDGPDDSRVIVAAGALMPDVTWLEAASILNSEVSPEFMAILDDDDELVGIEWVTQTLVFQGNTRTSLSTSERVEAAKAQLRTVRGKAKHVARLRRALKRRRSGLIVPNRLNLSTNNNASQGGDTMKTPQDIADAIEAGTLDKAAVMKACGTTPCGPCAKAAEAAEVDSDTDKPDEDDEATTELQAQLDAMTAERDAALLAQFESIEVDTTPLKAAINTHSELRNAVNAAIYEAYDTSISYAYAIDHSVSTDYVIYSLWTADGGSSYYRESYTVDLETHEVTLAGDATKVVLDKNWVEVEESDD